jgi:hypothetical protein
MKALSRGRQIPNYDICNVFSYDKGNVEGLVCILSCRVSSLPLEYLGLAIRCFLQDWEDAVFSFFEMLYSLRVGQGDVDRTCWSPSKRHKFEVKSYYPMLTIPTGSPFP